jgi:hypothetical protein
MGKAIGIVLVLEVSQSTNVRDTVQGPVDEYLVPGTRTCCGEQFSPLEEFFGSTPYNAD